MVSYPLKIPQGGQPLPGFIGRYGTYNHCPSLFKDRTLPLQPELARQNCRSPFQGSSACSMWRMACRNLPNARLVPVASTAEAVRESAKGGDCRDCR